MMERLAGRLNQSIGAAGMDCFEYLLAEGAPYNETKSIDIAAAEEDIAKEMAKLAAETEEADAKAADEARASSSSSGS
ncbi:hypothetical protein AXG93_3368s1080 [Marchantia polymorpha subsp. ruderalis]|uniref:Uncharacterized protein n=1 Tax=Marchantia polymorpha subsp. ruderalis TaxID=1480154 RepID=A0A176VUK4_MARPO|nr:hypothetical protein AXG93_3368s1080 [Marchantia polymorpha subsp. ruderalis]